MAIFSRDFLSRFWQSYVPFRKIKMYFLLKNNKNNIVIHTPGKVGSTSVYVTLKEILSQTHNIFHFHYLSKSAIKAESKKNLSSKRNSLPLHLIDSNQFSKFVDPNKKIKLIILLREPINRYLSATYQNLNMSFKDTHKTDINKINNLILDGIKNNNHLTDLDYWFDEELMSYTNIDVFKNDDLVSNDNGYWSFKKKNFEVYIIKMEELNTIFTTFCAKELDIADAVLVNSNVGKNKAYSEKYKQTKNSLQIPEDIIKKSKESRFSKRFYQNSI